MVATSDRSTSVDKASIVTDSSTGPWPSGSQTTLDDGTAIQLTPEDPEMVPCMSRISFLLQSRWGHPQENDDLLSAVAGCSPEILPLALSMVEADQEKSPLARLLNSRRFGSLLQDVLVEQSTLPKSLFLNKKKMCVMGWLELAP